MASSFSQEFANFVFFLVFDLFSISSYTRLSTLKLKFFLINNLKLYRGYIVEPLAWLGQASFDSNKIKIGVKFSLLWIVSIDNGNHRFIVVVTNSMKELASEKIIIYFTVL